MIYFIQERGKPESFIKIGTARCVETRVQQLEKEYGIPLDILGVCGGDRTVEKCIHAKFEEIRMGPKERFRPTPELLKYIEFWTWPWNDATQARISEIDQVRTVLHWGEEVTWLERVSTHAGLDLCSMLRCAVQSFANHVGFDEPHPDIRSGVHPARMVIHKEVQETSDVLDFAMEAVWDWV